MKGHNRLWMVLAGSAILIAGHGVILYVSSRLTVSTAIVVGVIVLVAAKHLGLLGPLYAILRKSRRQS